MRKGLKKILCLLTAATLVCGTASLSACGGYTQTPLTGGPAADDAVVSNGGFVVQKGDYVYFINGKETYTADNTFGAPVRGSLMRIKKEDADAGINTAETVIPSLMVAGDYTAGLFVYGDRVYYATPNNMKNTSGVVENTYLDFKSAKLDGSDIRDYFHISNNSAQYRYVEVEGTVYLMYAGTVTRKSGSTASALLSYNTETRATTELAASYGTFRFNSSDKTDPWIYYTMSVPNEANSQNGENISNFNYQQIYRVRADWTADKATGAYDASAPYKYEWTDKFLEATDGEAPYSNLGELVLDGRGAQSDLSEKYNHSQSEPSMRLEGYNYDLRSYANGGLYFVRTGGSDGDLYYLAAEDLKAGWDTVSANDSALDTVAKSTVVSTKATTSALYYLENGTHKYLYVDGSEIHRATVGETGNITDDLSIAFDVSGATLKFIDDADETYKYVYFTKSNGSGTSVERAVYNGDVNNYKNLSFGGDDNSAYKSVKVLDLQHATSWYDYEVLDGTVFYADAATIGSVSYNYVGCVDLKNTDGSLKNNTELSALNEKYEEIMGTKGLVTTLSSNSNSKLSALISYYFKTGKTIAYDDNLTEAKEHGRSETYLFSEAEQAAFKAFTEGKGDESDDKLFGADDYKDGEKTYRIYSYFATEIGKKSEADEEAIALAWRNSIQRDVVSETEEAGLEGWQIALIVIAAVLFVGGCVGLTVWLVLRNRKKQNEPEKPKRMAVDTTDDRDVDVYSPIEEPVETPAAPAEEATETAEPAEAPAEPAEATEAPAETPAEPAETTETTETPAEPTAPQE